MSDIRIETQNITQNITQVTYTTYSQTPIITDTLPYLIVGKSSNRGGLVKFGQILIKSEAFVG